MILFLNLELNILTYIIEILKETAKSITIKTKNKDNYIGIRRLFKTTLVARVNN